MFKRLTTLLLLSSVLLTACGANTKSSDAAASNSSGISDMEKFVNEVTGTDGSENPYATLKDGESQYYDMAVDMSKFMWYALYSMTGGIPTGGSILSHSDITPEMAGMMIKIGAYYMPAYFRAEKKASEENVYYLPVSSVMDFCTENLGMSAEDAVKALSYFESDDTYAYFEGGEFGETEPYLTVRSVHLDDKKNVMVIGELGIKKGDAIVSSVTFGSSFTEENVDSDVFPYLFEYIAIYDEDYEE